MSQHDKEDEVKRCIQKHNSVSRCAKELGIDVSIILDILSKIQDKPLSETKNISISLEKEKDLALYELINSGESDTLEFKASMLEPVPSLRTKSNITSNENLDRQLKGMRETLKNEVVTTISAFMNSTGGILLVGVQDDGSVYGLEKDFKAAGGKGDWDAWLQLLANLIRGKIGTEFFNYVKVERVIHDDKTVAKIVVEKSRRPAYIEIKDAAFYVRSLNTTTPLNTKQAHDYITDHWRSFESL